MSLLLLFSGTRTTGPPPAPQLPRIVSVKSRSTVTLATQSTLRLLGRSTLKLPKE